MKDPFDFAGDVCERCRHVLDADTCPSCGWERPRVEAPYLPYEPDDVPRIGGW